MGPKFLIRLDQVPEISKERRRRLRKVLERFPFRTNEYYKSLVRFDDPRDPIGRIVVPSLEELDNWGKLDASCENLYTPMRGLQHKYEQTALLLVSNVCGSICRFCFRKRLFLQGADDTLTDVDGALEYISKHSEINNILLTGGDPLMLSTGRLERIVSGLRKIDHVQIIRLGTKMPVFNPYRIINDPSLLEMIGKYGKGDKRIYIMTHINHPREITAAAKRGVSLLMKAGAKIMNQTPLIRGVNDDPPTLSELFNKLSYIGVMPYYVFQCRPTLGNAAYAVPIERGYRIFEQAKMMSAGLAKTARFAMSHSTGKIQIVARTNKHMIFKYLQAADQKNLSRIMIFRNNPEAYWLNDYTDPILDQYMENPFISSKAMTRRRKLLEKTRTRKRQERSYFHE